MVVKLKQPLQRCISEAFSILKIHSYVRVNARAEKDSRLFKRLNRSKTISLQMALFHRFGWCVLLAL